jgi:hypothetical protein
MGDPALGPDVPDLNAADPDAPERPRFPLGPALLAAACVVTSGWLWMAYSYQWVVSTDDLAKGLTLPHQSYVRIEANPERHVSLERQWGFVGDGVLLVRLADGMSSGRPTLLVWDGRIETPESHELFPLVGRVLRSRIDAVETPAGRFTPESVAGLVVTAMGLGVFALYLRKWLAERRAFRT